MKEKGIKCVKRDRTQIGTNHITRTMSSLKLRSCAGDSVWVCAFNVICQLQL